MRAVFALMLLVLAGAAEANEPAAARRVSVGDMAANAPSYYDKRLVVSGVLFTGAWGPRLCELQSGARDVQRICVDLDSINLPFRRRDPLYDGAIAEVVGYYSHSCFSSMEQRADGVVKVTCTDRGGNGWLTAESVRVTGAVSFCPEPVCDSDLRTSDVDLAASDVAGIDAFAARLVGAVRRGTLDSVFALLLASQRTEAAWYLSRDAAYARGMFLPPGLRHASDDALKPGSGYRLIRIEEERWPVRHQLCFCVSGDCAEQWRYAGHELKALQRIPIDCFEVWRGPQGWVLIY